MLQAGETLPIRLRPRKRSQIFVLIFFGFFFVFAVVWMIGVSRPGTRLTFNDVEITDPYWRAMYPLFGIPFALIGMCGLAVALLKVLPNSPCYYIELTRDGLTYRTLLKTQSFAWRDLPPFKSLQVMASSKRSSTVTYYAAALADTADDSDPREVLRISASEYGTRNNEQSADELSARLNRVREAALPSSAHADERTSPSQTAVKRSPSEPDFQAAHSGTGGPVTTGGTAETYRLPIRLLPRRGGQVLMIAFFSVFLAFAIFWTTMAAIMTGRADFGDSGSSEFWLAKLFPFFGVPFLLVGAAGIGRAILKMLPGSPYYHLEIDANGLLIRSAFKQRRYAWRELPEFDTLERRRSTKNGVRIDWYTVAMERLPPKPGMPADASYQREVLRIFADEYGARNGQQDAKDLADWLNDLRARARDNRLSATEQVRVPAGFIANAVNAPGLLRATSPHTPTVVRR
jgi:hypothetical protein